MKPTKLNKYASNFQYAVGIDEAGRGCWAGPLVVASYNFTPADSIIERVGDSKKLSEHAREAIFAQLNPQKYTVYLSQPRQIDKYGLGAEVNRLVGEAVAQYSSEQIVLIDGQFATNFGPNTSQIIKGDSIYYCIALASIVAKVTRDRIMCDLAHKYPGYFFEKHKGYGTNLHSNTMREHGVTDIHRYSYKPVAQALNLQKRAGQRS